MADFQTTVELRAITGQLTQKLKQVEQKLKGVSAQVQKTQNRFKKFGSKVGGVFTKLNAKIKQHRTAIAGIGLALGLVIKKGVKDLQIWEDGIAQIATLGVKDLVAVESQLKSIRKEYGISSTEATKGYYDVISAGASEGAAALEQLYAATKLAKAGNTDLGAAIDVVTSGMNIFGDNGETATSIVDQLFLAVKFGKTTVEELGKTFGYVAPVIDAAGLSMADYAASMATVTAGGIATKQATTGLKAVLSNLIKVTPKAAKKAKELGLDFGVAALKAKGLVGVMQDIADATGGDVTQLGHLFDSIEAINAVAVLTSNTGLASLERNFNAMSDSAGTVAEALEKVKKTASYNFGKFNQSLSIMSETIGAAVVPGLLKMVDVLGPVVDFFAALITQHPGLVKMTLAITALGVALAFIGGPITLAITAVGYALKMVAEHFNLFEEGGVAALEKMTLAWNNFWAGFSISEGGFDFAQWGTTAAATIKDLFGKAIGWFSEAFNIHGWDDFFDGAVSVAKSTFQFIKAFWTEIFSDINFSDVLTSLYDGLLVVIKGVGKIFESIDWNGVGKFIGDSLIKALAFIGELITDIVVGAFSTIGDLFKYIFTGEGASESSKVFGDAIMAVLRGVANFFGGLLDGLGFTGMFTNLKDGLIGAAKAMVDYITSGISRAISSITSSISGIGSSVSDAAGSAWDFVTGNKDGGLISAPKQHFATGGFVSGAGTATSDSIPAMLSDGEYVINAKATKENFSVLEKINSGDTSSVTNATSNFKNGGAVSNVMNRISNFKCGGLVHKLTKKYKDGGLAKPHFAEGGTVDDAKSYQFLQFAGEGRGSFDVEKTISEFVGGLDKADPAVQKVVRKMEELARYSNNLTKEQILEHDYAQRINKELIDLLPLKKKEAEVTKGTTGAVKDLGEAAEASVKKVKNEFEGFAQSFTGPIKNALATGGSIGDAFKAGARGLFQKLSSKFLDKAFAPLEKLLDDSLNSLFGLGDDTAPTGSSFDPINVVEAGAGGLGGLLGGDSGGLFGGTPAGGNIQGTPLVAAINETTNAVTMGTKKQGGLFGDLGSLLSQGWDWLSSAFGNFTSSLGGLFSGMGGGGSGGGIGGLLSSIFGGGGGIGGLFGGGGSIAGPIMGLLNTGGYIGETGKIHHFASGGMVPGSGNRDSVPAMLTPGEMVLTKGQQNDMGGGATTYNTYNLEISGNVDDRAVAQIRAVIQGSPDEVSQASRRGERQSSGIRKGGR